MFFIDFASIGTQKIPKEALFKGYFGFDQFFFVQNELQAVKYSFITYVWSKVDVFFCYSVYLQRLTLSLICGFGPKATFDSVRAFSQPFGI